MVGSSFGAVNHVLDFLLVFLTGIYSYVPKWQVELATIIECFTIQMHVELKALGHPISKIIDIKTTLIMHPRL